MKINRVSSKIVADDEVMVEDTMPEDAVSDLLFEADDVAELLSEVTGEEVGVDTDEDTVIFTVGDDEYTIEAEGDEEELTACTKPVKARKDDKEVKSSARARKTSRPVKASQQSRSRTVRRIPRGK